MTNLSAKRLDAICSGRAAARIAIVFICLIHDYCGGRLLPGERVNPECQFAFAGAYRQGTTIEREQRCSRAFADRARDQPGSRNLLPAHARN